MKRYPAHYQHGLGLGVHPQEHARASEALGDARLLAAMDGSMPAVNTG